jgi:hypothetical protein
MGAGLADWHVWADWRTDKTYNAAMKPWLVGKYLAAHTDTGPVLVLDPDALPLRQWPDAVPGVLYGRTRTPTPARVPEIQGCVGALCDLVGVDRVWAMCGCGAQYVTDLPGPWWEAIAELSVVAHRLLSTIPAPAGDPTRFRRGALRCYVTQLAAIRDGIRLWRTRNGHGLGQWSRSGWESHGFFHDAGQTRGWPSLLQDHPQSSPWGKPLAVPRSRRPRPTWTSSRVWPWSTRLVWQ